MPEDRIPTDKRTEMYSFRIPEVLKHHLSKLPKSKINVMNERLMVLMARTIHEDAFDPSIYLTSDEESM